MTRKPFFKGQSCFKFNNLGLALVMALKFYTGVGKRVKTRSQKVLGVNSNIYRSCRGKLVGRERGLFGLPVTNRVKTWPYRNQTKIDFAYKLLQQVFCKKFRTILCTIITWETKNTVFVKVYNIFLVLDFPQMFNSNWTFHSLW